MLKAAKLAHKCGLQTALVVIPFTNVAIMYRRLGHSNTVLIIPPVVWLLSNPVGILERFAVYEHKLSLRLFIISVDPEGLTSVCWQRISKWFPPVKQKVILFLRYNSYQMGSFSRTDITGKLMFVTKFLSVLPWTSRLVEKTIAPSFPLSPFWWTHNFQAIRKMVWQQGNE